MKQTNLLLSTLNILSVYIVLFLGIAYAEDLKTVSIKFITPITIGETKDVKGNFTNLTAKAQQLGLDDYLIVGKLTTEQPINGKRKFTIQWHSLQKQTANGTKSTPLNPALKSQFKAKASLKVIKPNTNISAKGDLNSVIVALSKVKAETEKAQKVKVDNPNDLKTKPTLANKQYGGSDGGTASSSGSNSTGSSDLAKLDSDTEQVKQCNDRTDITTMFAFVQERKATVAEDGTEKDAGICRDTGKKYTMKKIYGGACTPLVTGTQVLQSYRVVYSNGKQDVIAQDCTRDTKDNILTVVETTNGCSAKLDFANMKAIKQTRKYYTLDGVVNTVQACSPSATKWAITEENCQWQYDPANNVAIKSTKLVYTDSDNQKQNARACTAKTGGGSTVTIKEEFADKTHIQNYINDFPAKTAWLKSRKYYLKDGGKVYVSNWDKGSKTYAHQEVIGACTIEKDNDNLKARQNFKTMIAVDGTDYKVRDCQGGKWVNYKYLATVWKPESIIKNALIYGKHVIISSNIISKDLTFSSYMVLRGQSCIRTSYKSGAIRGTATHRTRYTKHIYEQQLLINNSIKYKGVTGFSTTPTTLDKNVYNSGYNCSWKGTEDSGDLKGISHPTTTYTQIAPSASWIGGGTVNLNDKANYTTASKLLGRTNVVTYHRKQKYKVLGNTFFYNYPTDSSGDNVINTTIRLDNNANPTDIN